MILDKYNLSDTVADAIGCVIVARRQGVQTTAISVPAARSVDLMTDLQTGITNKLVELFMLGKNVFLDLDSATENVVRFYVQRVKQAHAAYPFNAERPANSKHVGLGFFFDKEADQVRQYKHYFFERETPSNLYNFKFEPDGTFIGSYFQSECDGAEYTDLAAGIDPDAWGIQYCRRTDNDQSYMIIKPRLETPTRL